MTTLGQIKDDSFSLSLSLSLQPDLSTSPNCIVTYKDIPLQTAQGEVHVSSLTGAKIR